MLSRPFVLTFVLCAAFLSGCAGIQGVSNPRVSALTGESLFIPGSVDSDERLQNLAAAKAEYERTSGSLDSTIWLGRRLAYLWRYQDAINVFSQGLKRYPASPELYRHRGHRYLSIRRFGRAISDFKKAAALAAGRELTVEPDGIPNRLNQPLSNLHFNIYYHWGLAHYFTGEFEKAAKVLETCLTWSVNPDLKVATIDWLYMIHRRLGQDDRAESYLQQVSSQWQLVENDGYLSRIRLYKGEIQPGELLDLDSDQLDDLLVLVTQGYGVANHHFYNGDKNKALRIMQRIRATDYWSAFGYIAAEADLARH
ncbi:MAG: tetratricopeptide repeat protein [Pseudomonadota bacterium]